MKKKNPSNSIPPRKHSAEPSQKEKEAAATQAMEEGLMEIYKEGDGIPDMSKIERKQKSVFKKILIVSLIVLGVFTAVTWAGFFAFQNLRAPVKKIVDLSIQAPATLASGEEMSYAVRIQNSGRDPISRITVTAHYPEGFIFEGSVPKPLDEKNNSWSLGTLAGLETQEIAIQGRLLGNINTEKNLSVSMDYRPANFNADFEEVASATTTLAASAIEINLTHDEFIIAEEETSLSIEYKNTQTTAFPKTRFTLTPSSHFALKKADPEIEEGETNTWILEGIEPKKNSSIELRGVFNKDSEDTETFIIKVESQNEKGDWLVQQEKTFLMNVLKGELLTNIILNGSRENKPVRLGDTLNISLIFSNKGDTEMKNLVVAAHLLGNALHWDSLVDKNNGKIKDGVITWTSKEALALKSLAPNEEGELNLQIKLKNGEDFKSGEKIDSDIQSFFTVEIGSLGQGSAKTTATSPTLVNVLNSDLNLTAQGRYYNDDDIAVGTGPVPPEVGKTTSYRIFWTLENSLHEVNTLTVKSVLPPNVFWTGKSVVGAGQLNFDVNTRAITWTLNKIPLSVKKIETNFEVSVTPTASDGNTVLTLLPETTLEASDSITKEKIFLASGAITSNLDGDPVVEGKGLVKQ